MANVLFYDGQCPLCSAEMKRLRKMADNELELRDVHVCHEESMPARDAMLRSLHLQTADGRWITGVDANVAAWQHTRVGLMWRCLQWPLIRPLVTRAYERWAQWRYKRLYGQDMS